MNNISDASALFEPQGANSVTTTQRIFLTMRDQHEQVNSLTELNEHFVARHIKWAKLPLPDRPIPITDSAIEQYSEMQPSAMTSIIHMGEAVFSINSGFLDAKAHRIANRTYIPENRILTSLALSFAKTAIRADVHTARIMLNIDLVVAERIARLSVSDISIIVQNDCVIPLRELPRITQDDSAGTRCLSKSFRSRIQSRS